MTGASPMSTAFGAKVDIAHGAHALCLVVTRGSPVAALNSVGAQPLAALSPTRAIAIVDMTRLSTLQRHADVITAGSVSVDQARFAHFLRIVGQDRSPESREGVAAG